MTNREWIATLTNEQLAAFMTLGLLVKRKNGGIKMTFGGAMYWNIDQQSRLYNNSTLGISDWLSKEQEFEIAQKKGDLR